jgi:tetratricopeptide (TPR) repeat protein/transcriptional regulator with XRE-family HTH domain
MMAFEESYPFGDLLRGFRQRARISREALAQRLGVHINTLAHWENGNYLPRKKVKQIALALSLNEQETSLLFAACFENLSTVEDSYHSLLPPTLPAYIQQREAVVSEVYKLLTRPEKSAVVLTGLAGAGKSTLAALVYRHAEKLRTAGQGPFPAPAIWFRGEPSMTMTTFVQMLLRALKQTRAGIEKLTPQDQAMVLLQALKENTAPCLLVIDQFEDLLTKKIEDTVAYSTGFKEWLEAINNESCDCRILLTARFWPLHNHLHRSICLQEHGLKGLEDSEGIALLHNEGISAPENTLRRAVERCGGHPLALFLLASLLQRHKFSLQTLLDDPASTLLWQGDIAYEILDSIHEHQLTDEQRQLLSAFSPYREPVPLEAALFLLEGKRETRAAKIRWYRTLTTLLTQHLLQTTHAGHYLLHTLIGDYVRQRLQEGETSQLQQTHRQASQYYRQLAEAQTPDEQHKERQEHYLVESVWHLCQAGAYQQAYELMEQYQLYTRLHTTGGNMILLELYSLMLPLEAWGQQGVQPLHVYYYLAEIYRVLGQMERSRSYYEQELEMCRQRSDQAGEARVLFHLGWHYHDVGERQRAKYYHEQALCVACAMGDRIAQARAISGLGWFYTCTGDKKEAERCQQEALAICRELGNQEEEGIVLARLATVYEDSEQKELAIEYLEQALIIARITRNPRAEAWRLSNLGKIFADLKRFEQAYSNLKQALHLFQQAQDRRGEAWMLFRCGGVCIELGQLQQAEESLEQAFNIFREVRDSWGEAAALDLLGQLCSRQGNIARATIYYRQALLMRREGGDNWGEGQTLFNIGLLFLRQQPALALAALLLANEIFEKVQSVYRLQVANQLDVLQKELGEADFLHLKIKVEQQPRQILEEGLA